MDSFSSAASNGSSSSQFSTEDFMDKLKAQLAEAYAEEFLESKVLELGDLKNAAEAVIFGAYRGDYYIKRL